MPYGYDQERPWVLTDEGQRAFLKFRDKAKLVLAEAGCFTLSAAVSWRECTAPDTFKACSLVDRMEEIGELRVLSDSRDSDRKVYGRP